MEYQGKLYGKVGKKYFPLIETTEDIDRLKAENAKMKAALAHIKNWDDEASEEFGDPGEYAAHVLRTNP